MSFWNTITPQHVCARFNNGEKAAYESMQTGPNDLGTLINDVVATTRGKIKSGGKQLGPVGTIPDSLKVEVISTIIWLWITSFSGNPKLATEGRKGNFDKAEATLTKVAEGKQPVELPDAGQTDAVAAPVNSIQKVRGRNVRTDQFDRLGET